MVGGERTDNVTERALATAYRLSTVIWILGSCNVGWLHLGVPCAVASIRNAVVVLCAGAAESGEDAPAALMQVIARGPRADVLRRGWRKPRRAAG